MDKDPQDISGYLIVGGKSARFGSDKRTELIDGLPMLHRAYNLLSSLLNYPPTLVGDNLGEVGQPDWRVINDAQPDCGPLAGLVAALEDCSTQWLLTLAGDLPDMNIVELTKLVSLRDDQYSMICLSSDNHPEPLAAVYQRSSLDFWRGRLGQNQLSIVSGFDLLEWKRVLVEKGSCALRNVNRPEDIT